MQQCIACKNKKEQNKQCPFKPKEGERFCGNHLKMKKKIIYNMNSESNDKKMKNNKKKAKTKKITEKQSLIDDIFKPDNNGKSEWVPIEILIKNDLWSAKSNGNQRNGIFLNEKRYDWDSTKD